MEHSASPCLCCTRVKDPVACNNKHCIPWQQWFTGRWESARKTIRDHTGHAPLPPAAIKIGGRSYIAPNQIRYYLENDPCQRCACDRGLCSAPCRVRRAWEEARKEVFV